MRSPKKTSVKLVERWSLSATHNADQTHQEFISNPNITSQNPEKSVNDPEENLLADVFILEYTNVRVQVNEAFKHLRGRPLGFSFYLLRQTIPTKAGSFDE
jgi:hypothetical protein